MLKFDPLDPYPEARCTYAEAQKHSALVDVWLGLDPEKAEAASANVSYPSEQNLWLGLPPKALLTPYTELREILALLNPQPGELVIDLGAAYGRMGFVIARHFPGVNFVGYEMVKARVDEGSRVMRKQGLPSGIRLLEADLSSPAFVPESADYYFIYDFGSRAAITKALADLREVSGGRRIQVVGRGRAVRDAIELKTPWLSQVHPPRHFAHFSIYKS